MERRIVLLAVGIGLALVTGFSAHGDGGTRVVAPTMESRFEQATLSAESFDSHGFRVSASRNRELAADFTANGFEFDALVVEADDVFQVTMEKGRPMSTGGGVGVFHRDSGDPMLSAGDRNGDGRIDMLTYSVLDEEGVAIREVIDYDADGQADLRIHFDQSFSEIWHQDRWHRIERRDGVCGIEVDGAFMEVRNVEGRPVAR